MAKICKSLAVASVVALMTLSWACSSAKAKQAAEQAVAKFHGQLDGERFHDIYSESSSEFQKSGSETEMNTFFSAVHRKLGNVKSAREQTFFVNFSTSGTFVTLTYDTEFANGRGTEQFVWRVEGPPKLVNYQVNSRALITN